jgi:ribose transport system substrate-binding protein
MRVLSGRRGGLAAAAALCGVALLASACASSSAGTGAGASSAAKDFKIGVLVPEDAQNAYSAAYVTDMTKAAASLGVRLTVLNSNYTASVQQSQMQQLVDQKVNGIILWPAVYGSTTAMMLEAKKAGIPVDVSNSVVGPADDSLFRTFTGPSQTRLGVQQADEVNSLLHGTGNVVIIEGQPGNTAATGRLDGFEQEIAKVAPRIKILGVQPGDWLQAMSQTATSNLLTRYGAKVDAVVAADDVAAAGAAQAIASAGLAGKVKLVGAGYYQMTPALIKNGEETATLFQSPCWDAVHALQEMIAVMKGQTVSSQYLMPIPTVTKANMSQYTPMGCPSGTSL